MALGGTVDVLATDDPDAAVEEHEELQIYEKHNNLLHGSKRKRSESTSVPLSPVLITCDCNRMETFALFQG